MVEEILAGFAREWLLIATITNQGRFDMPTKPKFMGCSVSECRITGTEETTHTVKDIPAWASLRAPCIPNYISMALGTS